MNHISFFKTKMFLPFQLTSHTARGQKILKTFFLMCKVTWNTTFRDEKADGEVYIDDGESMDLQLYSHIAFHATPGSVVVGL